MEGAALSCAVGERVVGKAVGALVGLAEGKLFGHDCVYDGAATTWLGSVCMEREGH